MSGICWSTIKDELEALHRQWSRALTFDRENVTLAGHLATLLRNLCRSQTIIGHSEDDTTLAMILQSMTHEEVIRVIDGLIPKLTSHSIVLDNMQRFRDRYYEICETVIKPFDPYDRNTKFLWMESGEKGQRAIVELVDMLAECVSGLLGHMTRTE
jgi:hypothetical protein